VKSALALVVHLFLKHSKVTESSSMVQDSASILLFKKTTNNDAFHSNSFGKVNANFAHFGIDFLPMLLLFDAYSNRNANASPASWVGRNLSSIKEDCFHNMSEQEMIQENQLVHIKICLKQNEDMAWKLFGTNNKKSHQLGSQVGELDSL
jgi:hypothetical protein